ncbi:MAG: MarR family transcriptional regulator [Solirubrobacterales bacterium]|nr:MarR family transcriptional regulator [Solirubrobacterales bacterium]
MKFPDHGAVNVYTGFLLRKVSAASFEAWTAIVSRHGLHPMHFGLLLLIDAEEPVSQQELSRRSGIDPSTMVARMDVLVGEGLVERTRSEEDRRSYEIRLTEHGRDVLAKLRAEAKAQGDRFFAPLTDEERGQLHELLAKLAAGLDEPPA